jgi:hypothetical protein
MQEFRRNYAKSAYEMLAKRDKVNILNETLNKHLLLFGAENYYKIKISKIFSEEARNQRVYIEKGTKVRYMPYNSQITINIIRDLTILEIFSTEIIMISIEREEISKSFIDQFEVIWKVAKK